MLSQAAYDWGKQNKPQIQRGPGGTLFFSLHGFVTRTLSKQWELAKNSGPSGRFAFMLMMAAVGAGAGAMGLTGAQDTMNAADAMWKHFTGKDPDLKNQLRDATKAGLGQTGADVVLNGPIPTALGVNLGIGFGDPISREFDSANLMGTMPSIIYNAIHGGGQRIESHQVPAAVAAEAAPGAFRGMLRAEAAREQGVKSRKGVPQIEKGQVSMADLTRMATGFQPLTRQHMGEETERYYKTQSPDAWVGMIKNGDTAVNEMTANGWGTDDIGTFSQQVLKQGLVPAEPQLKTWADMIRSGDTATKEMEAAGWSKSRILGLARQALTPPGISVQRQRFEQQRGVAPPP
jgi:hypothetical protein